MSGTSKELLLEIAVLAKRYPPEEWKRVLRMFEDESTRETVISLLNSAAGLAAEFRTIRNEGRVPKSRSPEREANRGSATLNRSLHLLVAELPMPRLKQLAKEFRVPTSPKDSRVRLVKQITSAFQTRGNSAKNAYLHLLRQREPSGEYGKWVKIILGKST